MNLKVGVFITVRLGSTRLPNKALLKIKEKPTIVHLIDRIKQTKEVDLIVLCTTSNNEDRKLIELAKEQNIKSFAGDEKDIIKRHYDAANYYNIDFVINVDGDDLFCDPGYIDEIAREAKKNFELYDVITTKNLPFGVNSFGYKKAILKEIYEKNKNEDSETGWGEFFRDNKELKRKIIEPKEEHSNVNARMTLDYEEDFEFFKTIYDILYEEGKFMDLDSILSLLKNRPELMSINKSVEEIYWINYENKKLKKKDER